MMSAIEYLKGWSKIYRSDLTGNIMPFWLKFGLDTCNGGCYTCVDRDGTLMDTTKSVWFQGRFAFTCAYAYNNVERREEWLEAARRTIEFIEKYCFDSDGRMFFEVTAEGKPLRKRRYLFSEAFAAIAMSEYSIASGDVGYADKALALFRRILHYANTPGLLSPKYDPSFRTKGHSLTMILINTASRIREAVADEILDTQIERSIRSIRDDFMHHEFGALLETVGPDGEFVDTIMGRTINPGHCIETAWFILEEARYRGWDGELVTTATTILDWSWQWGWDTESGGIVNFRDCKGFPSQDYAHDMKFWWPQTETIIAALYAFLATGEGKYLDMHKTISDYTWSRFPDPEYGEWYGYLHRDGSVSQSAKGNLFKGPFHIPRMMIKSHMLCEELICKL